MSKNIKRSVLFSAFCTLRFACASLRAQLSHGLPTRAKTNVNEIKSGTLDVTLQMQNDEGEWVNAEGETLSFLRADAEGNRLPGRKRIVGTRLHLLSARPACGK